MMATYFVNTRGQRRRRTLETKHRGGKGSQERPSRRPTFSAPPSAALTRTHNTSSVRWRVPRLLLLRFYERSVCGSPWKRRSSTPASHVTESQALLETQAAGAEIALERGRGSGLSSLGSTATTTARRRALAMRSRVRATLRMGLTASTSRLLRAELCDWPKRSSAISSRMRSRTLNNGAIGNLASFG